MRLFSHIGKDDIKQTYCCDHSHRHTAAVCCTAIFRLQSHTHIHTGLGFTQRKT